MSDKTTGSQSEIVGTGSEGQKPLDKLLNIVGEAATAIREYALVLHPDSRASQDEKNTAFAYLQSEWTKLHALKGGLDSDAGRSFKMQMGPDHKILSEIEDIRKNLGLSLQG